MDQRAVCNCGKREKFPKVRVKEIAEYILKDIFQDFKFDNAKEDFKENVHMASDGIAFVLRENLPKYDFFVQVTISEKIGQALLTASMCLWDQSTDDYAIATYDAQEYIVIANIYGVWKYN